MIRLCHRCGNERHSRSRYCEECASDLMQQRMREAYRVSAIVPRETIDDDAEHLARAVADLADELAANS